LFFFVIQTDDDGRSDLTKQTGKFSHRDDDDDDKQKKEMLIEAGRDLDMHAAVTKGPLRMLEVGTLCESARWQEFTALDELWFRHHLGLPIIYGP
jgi:hypothetical protein